MVIWTTGFTFIKVFDSLLMVQLMASKGKMFINVFIFLSFVASNNKKKKKQVQLVTFPDLQCMAV